MHRPRSTTALLAWIAGAGILAASGLGHADDEIGTGTYLATGSKVTTSIDTPFDDPNNPNDDDKDLFIFNGYAGQTVSITVAAPKSSRLIPFFEVFRPDQRTVSSADGAKVSPKPGPSLKPAKTAKLTYKLDQTGVWTIRVRGGFPGRKVVDDPSTPLIDEGDDPSTPDKIEASHLEYDYGVNGANRTSGQYTISVKYTTAPAAKTTKAVPGPDGVYRFRVPATGGAQLNGLLTFKGSAPTFDKVFDPTGADLGILPTYAISKSKSVTLRSVPLPAASPAGSYTVTFRAPVGTPPSNVTFSGSAKVLKAEKPLKSKLSLAEPIIEAVNPAEGGPDINVILTCLDLADPAGSKLPRVFLGRIEMVVREENISVQANRTFITFRTPASSVELPDGTYDVRVTSSTGQAATKVGAFTIVPPPVVTSLEPEAGSEAGGFLVTIKGSNFSTTPNGMIVRYVDKSNTSRIVSPPVTFLPPLSSTELRYYQPTKTAFPGLGHGEFFVRVENYVTHRSAQAPQTIRLADAAAISRVSPSLIPILGGETIYVKGANFRDTDHVFLEKTPNSAGGPSDYEDITLLGATFVSDELHQFVAPPRVKGTYRLFVRDTVNAYDTPTRTFAFYQLSDFTASMGLTGTDGYDAYTTALGDFNPASPKFASPGDREDLFLTRKGGDTIATTSQTRVFRNDGAGSFTDVTATVMPGVTADDDWRADKIVITDIDLDGYPDMVLATASDKVLSGTTKSHVRILLNEARGAGQPATERTFRDHTADLMAPLRKMNILYSAGGLNEVDDWRAKDMFVGDIDFSNKTPPEIVIVNDKVFENYYVSCTPYCASPYSAGYTYSFYWGGTRVFKWDQSARSGLGRYKYDANYFPRKSGITVPIFNAPPGVVVPTCTPSQCRGKFTPFTGQRLAVGDFNYDPAVPSTAKPDFAILNNQPVTRNGATIPSLQVALNQVGGGVNVTDVTDDLSGLDASGGNFKADAVAIGHPGFKGSAFGVIAIAKVDPTGLSSSALRFLRFKASTVPGDPGDFEEITNSILPATTANDRFQSSQIRFLDVDGDGDEDLVTLSRTAPGGNGPAIRIFRNNVAAPPNLMVYGESLKGLFTGVPAQSIPGLPLAANGYYDGDSLAIGDLDGDKVDDYVITRSTTPAGVGPHTRAIKTDK